MEKEVIFLALGAAAYYENISNSNIQGISASAYTESISLLANKDAFKYNLLIAPGLIADPTNFPLHNNVVNQMITTVQERGDSMVVTDVVGYGSNITPVVTSAQSKDTSYAATYWPWLLTIDPNTSNSSLGSYSYINS
jgi:hypothetical protein